MCSIMEKHVEYKHRKETRKAKICIMVKQHIWKVSLRRTVTYAKDNSLATFS